jgi:hypothetical protein
VAGAPADATQLVSYNGLAYYGAGGTLYSYDGDLTFTPISIAPATDPFGLTVFDGALYFTAGDGVETNVYSYAAGVTTKTPGAITETLKYVEYDGGLYYLGFADGQPTMNVIRDGAVSVVPGSPQYTFNLTVFDGKLYFSGDTADGTGVIMYVLESTPDPVTPTPEPTVVPPADVAAAAHVDPTLAATGSELWVPGLLALALLAVGAAALLGVRGRRA